MVSLGTSVVSGTGIARVLATGQQTSFGGIAEGLVERPEEAEFERGLRHWPADHASRPRRISHSDRTSLLPERNLRL
jgi:hypothetical protein